LYTRFWEGNEACAVPGALKLKTYRQTRGNSRAWEGLEPDWGFASARFLGFLGSIVEDHRSIRHAHCLRVLGLYLWDGKPCDTYSLVQALWNFAGPTVVARYYYATCGEIQIRKFEHLP
jgi:hypothetical protein